MFKFNTKRYFVAFVILFVCGFCKQTNAQSKQVEVVDLTDLIRAQPNPIQISKSWKFQPGDSLNWASKDYNDSNWAEFSSVINEINIDSIKKAGWNGIGWFRKQIFIDSSLADYNLALTVYQRAATEIYIDGKLWKQFGKVSSDRKKERLIRNLNFFISPLEIGKVHQLAIRVSNHKVDSYINNSNYGGFSLIIAEFERLLAVDRNNLLSTRTHSTILITFTGAFFLFHFLMYLFYPKEKTNLWYALAVGAMSLSIFFASNRLFTINSDNLVFYRQLEVFFVIVFHVIFLRLCYSLFDRKLGFPFLAIFGIALAFITYMFVTQITNPIIFTLFTYIVYIEIVRVLFFNNSKAKDSSSTWIISVGISATLAMIFYNSLIEFGLIDARFSIMFGTYFSVIPVMISMSVFQARDLAKNNEILEYRLARINMLSDQNLKQAKRELELRIESEKQKSLFQEAEYRAKVVEIESKAIADENARKSKELEEARNLQLSMLPKKLPHHPYLEFAAHMTTATEVGGDYYDFMMYKNDSVCLAIGDATGHGLSAGTMVATIKALFRNYRIKENKDIVQLFHSMTSVLKVMNFKKIFMSLTVAKIHNHELVLSAAGMPPAMLFKSETNEVDRLIIKGMPLGSVIDFPYEIMNRTIHKNDIILFVSDGITELFNEKHDMFGQDKIEELVLSNMNKHPEEIINILLSEAEKWRGVEYQHDDITIVAIKVMN